MLGFIFVFLIGVFRDCGRINTGIQEGRSGGDTLDIALLYGPGSFYIYQDSLAGINHDVAIMFERDTKIPVKIWPLTEPKEGMTKLENGTFDILASLPLDNNIKRNFPVSESIFLDKLVLIQMADSLGNKKINSSLDLNGKEIFVASGSSAVHRLKNLSEEIGGDIKITELPEVSDELITLQIVNGTYPLAVVNERVARDLAKNYPDLRYDSSVSFTQFQVWLFNPEDSIPFQEFNKWFEEFKTSDDYRKIITKY